MTINEINIQYCFIDPIKIKTSGFVKCQYIIDDGSMQDVQPLNISIQNEFKYSS